MAGSSNKQTSAHFMVAKEDRPASHLAEKEGLLPSWEPLQAALLAFHRGDRGTTFRVHSTVWEDEDTPATSYYRPLGIPLPRLERQALDLCRAPVLDLGAGAGRLSLELQDRGLTVTAIDIAPVAVEIMLDRGVADARCEDLYDHQGGPYATLLLTMHGIGVVGSHEGLEDFFEQAKQLLEPHGQIICDSADLGISVEDDDLPPELAYDGQHQPGQVFFQIAFGDLVGECYPWLFISEDQLSAYANLGGFDCEIIARADRGRFLARLTLKG